MSDLSGWMDTIAEQGRKSQEAQDERVKKMQEGLPAAIASLPSKPNLEILQLLQQFSTMGYDPRENKIKEDFRVALETEALRRMGAKVTVSVMTMKCSGGDDHFVQFECEGRKSTPHVFKERFKAEYHVAHYDYIFNGGTEPELMAYNEDSWPGKED